MERDLKLAKAKLRAAKKMPYSNPKEYRLRESLIRHWELEKYKLMYCIREDLARLSKNNCVQPPQDGL